MRWGEHKRAKEDMVICRAIRKYGYENFSIKEVDSALTQKELDTKERKWIRNTNSLYTGYNTDPGGIRGVRGLGKARKGHPQTEKTRNKIRKSMLGKNSDNVFSKRDHCNQGHKYSKENTRIYRGRRICRECSRSRSTKHYNNSNVRKYASKFDPIEHGTYKGYCKELRLKMPTCGMCKKANRIRIT